MPVGSSSYGGTVTSVSGNPFGTRPAFVATNPSYPATDTVTVDFGWALAVQIVELRFRIGADEVIGDHGWEIDDVQLSGLTNAPFTLAAPDATTCDGEAAPRAVPVPIRVSGLPPQPLYMVVHQALRQVPRVAVVGELLREAIAAVRDGKSPDWSIPPELPDLS